MSVLLSRAYYMSHEEEEIFSPLDLADCQEIKTTEFRCPGRVANLSDVDHFFVHKVYPPVIETEPRLVALAIVFLLCFIVCLSGNVSVLTMIRGLLKSRKRQATPRVGDHTIIYISALCVVDICISLSLPTAITDNLLGFWLYGRVLCKVHHVCGGVGRIASTFLITAITFDRYVAVCHPLVSVYRSRSFVYAVISGIVVVAVLLLLPLLIFSDTNEYVIHEFASLSNLDWTRVRVFKCSDTMPTPVFLLFTYSTFTVGFMLPLSLILFFDINLLLRLYAHTRMLSHTAIPLRRIVRYTLMITVIYFVGWTPYWWSVLYGSYNDINYGPGYGPDEGTLFLIYVLHAFPYLAVATNWIFYGLLNTQLQQRFDVDGAPMTTLHPSVRNSYRGETSRDSIAMLRGASNRLLDTNCRI